MAQAEISTPVGNANCVRRGMEFFAGRSVKVLFAAPTERTSDEDVWLVARKMDLDRAARINAPHSTANGTHSDCFQALRVWTHNIKNDPDSPAAFSVPRSVVIRKG